MRAPSGNAVPSVARALWAGRGARRALAAAAAGRSSSRCLPGGYVRLGDEWLLLAVPRAPRGPLTLLVAGLETAPLAAGDVVEVEWVVQLDVRHAPRRGAAASISRDLGGRRSRSPRRRSRPAGGSR